MFDDCNSLTSLNLNGFGKLKIIDAGSMFRGMKALTSLNLSNFDMSEVTDIGAMFKRCSSLTSLDLSNFQIDNINGNTMQLFDECNNLEYINLKNARFQPDYNFTFISAKKNLVFWKEDTRIISKDEGYGCAVIDCSENWRQIQKKINLFNNECVNDCSETNNNKYNYKNECYENCPDGTYNNNYICEDCHPDCKTCEKGDDIISTNCQSCADENKYLYFGNCYIYENFTFNKEVIEIIQDSLIYDFNTTSIDNGEDYVAIIENITYRITTTENQKRQKDDNITTIDLSNCGSKLKKNIIYLQMKIYIY